MKNSFHSPRFITSLALMLLVVAGCQSPGHSPASVSASGLANGPSTKGSQTAMTPRQAMAELAAGNARFASGHPRNRDTHADIHATAAGQYPYAIVLSCIDSRQPIEIVLDQGIGDIFSARVAGNIVNDDILGSMEFACKITGAKLIAVIGHSNCGAIKGAIDNAELGNLTGLLAHIKPAVDKVAEEGKPRSSKDHDLVDKVAEENVRLTMQQILERSAVLNEMLAKGQIGLVGGMYDLSTGKVTFYDK